MKDDCPCSVCDMRRLIEAQSKKLREFQKDRKKIEKWWAGRYFDLKAKFISERELVSALTDSLHEKTMLLIETEIELEEAEERREFWYGEYKTARDLYNDQFKQFEKVPEEFRKGIKKEG
jgi:hypothetical protein